MDRQRQQHEAETQATVNAVFLEANSALNRERHERQRMQEAEEKTNQK